MGETNDSSSDQPAWKSDQAPCVYCGRVIDRSSDRCPHCHTSFSLAVRKASREVVGDWYYLDPRNPSGRGVMFETLIKMIEKGRIKADSVVRGPTTHHDWMYAAENPRLAKYLGMCPHCFAEAKPEDTYCSNCQLNMNARPAEPRPGIPPDLAKEPFHKAAHKMERELAEAPGEPGLAPAVAPVPAPPPWPAPRPEPTPSATAAAAAADIAGPGAAVERKSQVVAAAGPGRRPKLWIVLVLTWGTLVPIVLLGYFFGVHDDIQTWLGGGTPAVQPQPDNRPPKPDNLWLQNQLAEAEKAEQAKDYGTAIRIYQGIIEKTGDTSWEKRIENLRRKPDEERKVRLAGLRERLEMAESLSADRRYDDALAVLRNISKQDRSWLASLGIGVDKMEETIRAAQTQYVKQQEQQKQLAAQLADAATLRAEKKLAGAFAAYTAIGNTFPADLIAKHIDLVKALDELGAEIAAEPPKPPKPPKPPAPPPDEAAQAVADLLAEAAGLEKKEKFAAALAKLEEIETKFDEKFWPDALEERIRQIKAKIEALQFFGINAPK